MSLVTLVFIILILIGIYYGLKYLALVVLKSFAEVEDQRGILSYGKVTFSSSKGDLVLEDTNAIINLFSIFSQNGSLLLFEAKSFTFVVKNYQRRDSDHFIVEVEEKKQNSPITLTILAACFQYFIHKISFKFGHFKVAIIDKFNFESDDLALKYSRKDGSYFEIEHSFVKIQDFAIKDTKYKLFIDEKAFLKLTSQSNTLFAAFCNFKNLEFSTNGNILTISPFSLESLSYPGVIKINVSKIVAILPKNVPQVDASIDEVQCDMIYPVFEVPHTNIEQLYVNIKGFNISSISPHLFAIDDIVIKMNSIVNGKPTILVNEVELNYTSLDGMELFQLIPMFRGPPPETPDRPVFDFPDFETTVKSMKVSFLFTDMFNVKAQSSNVAYTNKTLHFPIINSQFNDIEAIKVKDFKLYSKDKTFLDLYASKFVLIKHNEIDFAQCVDNALYGWNLVKKYISRGIFDSETLPFPIRMKFDEFDADFDDNIVNNSLEQIVKRTKDVIKDSVVLKYILKLKMDQCNLTDTQSKTAHNKVNELIFHNYKEAVGEIEEKKKLSIKMQNILAEFDSRDFTGMVEMLQKFDPTIKEYYPNVGWETLEGFKLALTINKIQARSFDLPEPLITVDRLRANGPLVFAEVKCEKMLDVKVTVKEKEFIVKKSVADMKVYSDFRFSFNTFTIYYGSCLLKIYDDFADCLSGVIPDGLDPSPPLRWWDKWRSMFRGKFDFKFEKLTFNFLGTSDPYNFKDIASAVYKQADLCFTEGVVALHSSSLQTTRCEGGPVFMYFPMFSCVATFIWDTEGHDQKKHLLIPDVDKFDDPTYDTYAPFRAKGFDIDLLYDFKPDEFTPFFSVDFAHREWVIRPIMTLFNYPLIEETYEHKYGMPFKKRPERMYLSSLNRVFTFRFNVPALSFRIFDYFPSLETTNINGTSVDFSLINPNLTVRAEWFPKCEDVYDVGLKADSIQLNATDLANYAKTTTINSTTIGIIRNIDMCYGKVSHVSISDIDFYFNQVLAMYINEFLRSIVHITNKQQTAKQKKNEKAQQAANAASNDIEESSSSESFSSSTSTKSRNNTDLLQHLMRRKSTQRIATIYKRDNEPLNKKATIESVNKVMTELFSAGIPKIRIIAESMNYEVAALVVITGTEISYKENKDKGLTAVQAILGGVSLFFDFDRKMKDSDPSEEVIGIEEIEVYQYSKNTGKVYNDNFLNISINKIKSLISTNQIASLKQIYSEVIPETPKEEKQLELAAEDYFSLKTTIDISQCMFNFKDQFLVNIAMASLDNILCNIDMKINGNTEATLTFSEISINDTRPDADFNGIVVVKSSKSKTCAPHLRVQMRTSPPVGGISVFNHFEMNLDPTIINYDAHFLDAVQAMFMAQLIAPKAETTTRYLKADLPVLLPYVLVPDNILPQISDSYTDFLQTFKSSEINVMAERAEMNFMMRYFKVTNANLRVSYRNEDNTIISEINDFNGELHDIIYQDLTTSVSAIIDKIISTVAKDMIPQFLKHLVGLGKISSSKEFELQRWLNAGNSDKTDVMARKKQLIFGKK